MPENILNLPCYKVLGIQENEHDYHIDVETLHAPTFCPHCQSSNLVGFGRRTHNRKEFPTVLIDMFKGSCTFSRDPSRDIPSWDDDQDTIPY